MKEMKGYVTTGTARPSTCGICKDVELYVRVYDSQMCGAYDTKASYVVTEFTTPIQRWCPSCGLSYLP